MVKKELLSMQRLNATPKMIEIAKRDVPKTTTVHWGAYTYQETREEYQLYMRCCIENDILKAALYYPSNLRTEGRLPSYEVYIDRNAGKTITYDRINSKWREAKVDRLEWPQVSSAPNVWASTADAKAVAAYLNSEKQGYERKLLFQLAYKYTGSGHAHGCVGTYTNRSRKKVGIDCTPAQYIEIEADFEFYRVALEEEMELFYTAFINKNKLFPPPELAGDIDDSGDIDLVRLERLKALMDGIERRNRNKALPDGRKDDE